MGFDFIVKHDGKRIQKAKVERIDDFEPVMDGLREKFGEDKKRRG